LTGPETGPIRRNETIGELAAPQVPGDRPATLLQRRPDTVQAGRYTQSVNVDRMMVGGWNDIAVDIAPKPQGLVAWHGKP